MTNQERTKILEMVAEGSLTIEQADQLLERLGAQSRADAEKRPDQSAPPVGFTTFTGEQMAALESYEVDEGHQGVARGRIKGSDREAPHLFEEL